MSTEENKHLSSTDYSFINEIKRLGFHINKATKMRYWTGDNNVFVVTTFLTQNNWNLRIEERIWEDVNPFQLEIEGNISHIDADKKYSIVTKSPSIWKTKTTNEFEKYYNLSGEINLEQTELGSSLIELNEIYLKVVCKAGQIDFVVLVEKNPSKHVQTIINFIACLIKKEI